MPNFNEQCPWALKGCTMCLHGVYAERVYHGVRGPSELTASFIGFIFACKQGTGLVFSFQSRNSVHAHHYFLIICTIDLMGYKYNRTAIRTA